MWAPQLPGLQDDIKTSLIVETPDTKLEKGRGVRDGLRIRSLPRACVTIINPRSLLSLSFSLQLSLSTLSPYIWFLFALAHFITTSSHYRNDLLETHFSFCLYYIFIFIMSSFVEGRNDKKRVRGDSDEFSESDSPEVKRLREDLLGFLDDTEPNPMIQDLDSVMKSFEEEISQACTSSPVPVVDLTDSGESQPELGYLLEASDDELGLPPSGNSLGDEVKNSDTELGRVSSYSSGIGELWGFEDQIPGYYSFEFGAGIGYDNTSEYVAFDGLFEHSDVYFDSSDVSDPSWRHETLPAQ